jgi:low temperature requirement protein LtrA
LCKRVAIILFVSRLCLTIEYGSILWHIRKFKKARLPMYLQIGLTFIASIIYLGIAFRFRDGNSRVFITWYIVSGMELILTIGISNLWEVLSFTKTHLMKRMSLLTIIFLGDSIVTIGTNVSKIVKTPDAWSTPQPHCLSHDGC